MIHIILHEETYEFYDRFTAEQFLIILDFKGVPAIKLRCSNTSDSIAINNYVELLTLNIH
jgi:hypothetical protein